MAASGFRIAIPDDVLDDLRRRLLNARFTTRSAETLIRADAQAPGHDHASMVQLAQLRAGPGLSMPQPAPAGLKDNPTDNSAGQSNLVGLAERVGDHRFRAT